MAAGPPTLDRRSYERHRRVRRKAIFVYVMMIVLMPVGLYAWTYWRLLKCQGEYYVQHPWMCRGFGSLPLLPEVALIIPWVLIAVDLIAIAELKRVPREKRFRAYQGFRHLDTEWHQLHVALAALIVPLAFFAVIALILYLRMTKHLMLM